MKKTVCLLLLVSAGLQLNAQVITASVTGNAVDPSGAGVPGATATLTNDSTKAVQTSTANATGTFSFAAVQPASYTLKLEHAGFKATEQAGIHVSAADHLALGDIT